MQFGTKGMKYGLQLPKKKVEAVQQPKKLSVFGGDDDSDDDNPTIGTQIARQAAKKQNDRKVAQLHAAALAEDASVFAYDEVYDSLKESEKPKAQEKKERKSRYIEGLLDKAKEREREQDIIYERQLLKERKAEDHLFGDKEKFVTAAYKKKLEEDQKWLAEEKIREARDAKRDVLNAGHMGNFYRNIMSNNTAFGTAQPTKRSLADRAPSAAATEEKSASPVDPEWEAARKAREAYEAAKERSAPAQEPQASETLEADTGERPSHAQPGPAPPSTGPEKVQHSSAASGVAGGSGEGTGGPEGAGKPAGEEEERTAPEDSQAPVVDKEAKAAAAKERYLARKRKAPGVS